MSGVVVLETLRRHFTHLAYVVALLALIVIVASMAALGGPGDNSYGMVSLFALIAGCQLIGPEFSSGTLQLILAKPIRRSTYLLSRWAGVVLALLCAIAVVFASDAGGRLAAHNAVDWQLALAGATAAALQIALVCALLAFFGSFSRSYLNVAAYLGLSVFLSMIGGLLGLMRNATHGELAAMGGFLRRHPGVAQSVEWLQENLFPSPPRISFDRQWMLMLLCNTAVVLLLACLVFRRREVPYGAD
jgi:ABC-2 type transport system permease protein